MLTAALEDGPPTADVRWVGQDRDVDMEQAERILDIVAAIPRGRVSTYGDVAARSGSPSPRLVGRILSELSEESTNWHRVLRADGRPAHHLAAEQLARLRAEGVLADDGRVDLRRYRWREQPDLE